MPKKKKRGGEGIYATPSRPATEAGGAKKGREEARSSTASSSPAEREEGGEKGRNAALPHPP